MRAWVVLLCLGHVTVVLLPQGTQAKRFDPSMVDPLSRRSSLDKNFMRFGRSSPSYTEEDETEVAADALSGAEPNKEENFLRSMRGKDNFIRFGRTRNDNFMRFGRGKQDNFMRFGKSVDDELSRESRGKQDSFIRFGRGKMDFSDRIGKRFPNDLDVVVPVAMRSSGSNFMRFGRAKQDNFMRFGREVQDGHVHLFPSSFVLRPLPNRGEGKQYNRGKNTCGPECKTDTLIRYGKRLADQVDVGVPVAMRSSGSNFMRFGRAKQDNFMRFGREVQDGHVHLFPSSFVLRPLSNRGEGKQYNRGNNICGPECMVAIQARLGKRLADQVDVGVPVAMRSSGSNFMRFGRAKHDNFMRFGKSIAKSNFLSSNEENKITDAKALGKTNYIESEPPSESELIPQRIKRSIPVIYESQDKFLPEKEDEVYGHIVIPLSSIQDDFEEEYSPQELQENYTNRKKRSVSYDSSTPLPLEEEDSSVDYISAKLRIDSQAKPNYQSTLLSAGLPNVIVGPEFSLLPDLDPPSTLLKRGRLGDQNFLRLG